MLGWGQVWGTGCVLWAESAALLLLVGGVDGAEVTLMVTCVTGCTRSLHPAICKSLFPSVKATASQGSVQGQPDPEPGALLFYHRSLPEIHSLLFR